MSKQGLLTSFLISKSSATSTENAKITCEKVDDSVLKDRPTETSSDNVAACVSDDVVVTEGSLKRDRHNDSPGISSQNKKPRKPKAGFTRQYDSGYMRFGFTVMEDGEVPRPQCVVCGECLSNECMKPSKMLRHLQTKHKDLQSKPIEYFTRRNNDLKTQKKTLVSACTTNESCLRASYKVALNVAKSKKAHTVAENLIRPCCVDIVTELMGEKAGEKIKTVPLSNDTIKRRIDDISEDIEDQLTSRIKAAQFYAIQLDESTDVTNSAILSVFVRYEYQSDFQEELLCALSLPTNTTSEQVFNAMDTYLKKRGIEWKNCVGVCTDGAAAMVGIRSGVATRIKQVAPQCQSTHCFIHREALAAKHISPLLNVVLQDVVKVVNYVKVNALNSRLFAALCKDMGSDHLQLLYHTEVRWLSRGKVLSRVYELRQELYVFLKEKKPDMATQFVDGEWLGKLAYLSDIFAHMNVLNQSMQGKMSTIFGMMDKIEGFQKKMKRWEKQVNKLSFDMFENTAEILSNDLINREISKPNMKTVISDHLLGLIDMFAKYFPEESDPRTGTQWIVNPFLSHENQNLSDCEEDTLLELSADSRLKALNNNCTTLQEFWIQARTEYPVLSQKALNAILPFPSSYLCETAFSQMSVIKTKHRNRLDVSSSLRVAVTNIDPRINKLAANKQAHKSHGGSDSK